MSERRVSSSSSRLDGEGDKLSSSLPGENLETILVSDGESLVYTLKLVVGRLHDAIQSTVANVPPSEKQDRCFLSGGDLERIINSNVLAQLFGTLVTDSDSADRCIAMTDSRRKLLALFLYEDRLELPVLFTQWLKSNGDDAPSDNSMPFSAMSLDHYGVPKRFHSNIIRDQNIFIPITIQMNQEHQVETQDRLPFIPGKTDFMKSIIPKLSLKGRNTITVGNWVILQKIVSKRKMI